MLQELTFRPLDLVHRSLVESYTMEGEDGNCDLSFANLYGWQFLYVTECAELDEHLLFRFKVDGKWTYLSPIPKGKEWNEERYVAIIEAIRRDAAREVGKEYALVVTSERVKSVLCRHFGGEYELKTERDYSDYLYRRDTLQYFAGKKLQSRRNHINRFKKSYPEYEYRKLSAWEGMSCLALAEKWAERKGKDEKRMMYDNERRMMLRIINNWDSVGITGGGIYVKGKMIGFCLGAPINHSTYDICIEKGDTEYDGVYPVICQEYVRHLPERYEWINREEDLGIDGLRQSKKSYGPDHLLVKYTAHPK